MRFHDMGRLAMVVCCGAVLAFGSSARPAQAQDPGDEVAVALDKLPAGLLETAKKAAPKVKIDKATKVVDEGKTYYNVYGTDEQGREVDIELSGRGQVLGVATETPMADIPPAIHKALKAKARGVKFTEAAVVTKNGKLISYRFEGENDKGHDVEATVSADGRTIEVEVDDE